VVIPIDGWNGLTERALRFALRISDDITAVHITSEKTDDALIATWRKHIEEPARAAGYSKPRLEVIHSPYRTVFQPILDYITSVQAKEPERLIATAALVGIPPPQPACYGSQSDASAQW
jgi:hypothetical protein